jgi:hypothetical protein
MPFQIECGIRAVTAELIFGLAADACAGRARLSAVGVYVAGEPHVDPLGVGATHGLRLGVVSAHCRASFQGKYFRISSNIIAAGKDHLARDHA